MFLGVEGLLRRKAICECLWKVGSKGSYGLKDMVAPYFISVGVKLLCSLPNTLGWHKEVGCTQAIQERVSLTRRPGFQLSLQISLRYLPPIKSTRYVRVGALLVFAAAQH